MLGFATIWFPIVIILVPKICGTNNELCVFGIEILSSHIGVDTLCCCNVSHFKVHAQMGGPIWVSRKPILPCGCHCNAHVA
jgi:hypothetical protein